MAGEDKIGSSQGPDHKKRREAGKLSAASETASRNHRNAIQKSWGISQVEDAFPASIKPVTLGISALSNLRAISNRVDLPAARVLFMSVSKTPRGSPAPFGFTSSATILEQLKANETSTQTPVSTSHPSTVSTPASKAKSTPASATSKSKSAPVRNKAKSTPAPTPSSNNASTPASKASPEPTPKTVTTVETYKTTNTSTKPHPTPVPKGNSTSTSSPKEHLPLKSASEAGKSPWIKTFKSVETSPQSAHSQSTAQDSVDAQDQATSTFLEDLIEAEKKLMLQTRKLDSQKSQDRRVDGNEARIKIKCNMHEFSIHKEKKEASARKERMGSKPPAMEDFAPGEKVEKHLSLAKKAPIAVMSNALQESQTSLFTQNTSNKRLLPLTAEDREYTKKIRTSETPGLVSQKGSQVTPNEPQPTLLKKKNAENQPMTKEVAVAQPSLLDTSPYKVRAGPENASPLKNLENLEESFEKRRDEQRRLNEEFFKRAKVRMALWEPDTIQVSHPSDRIQSTDVYKKEYVKPNTHTCTYLREECMKLPEAVQGVLGLDTIQNLATLEQRPLVDEVKRILTDAVSRLKNDLEMVFENADAPDTLMA